MAQLLSYEPPLPVSIVPHLSLVCISLGLFFLAWFFTQLQVTTKSRNLVRELFVSLVASLFLGFGVVFLMLTTRIYI